MVIVHTDPPRQPGERQVAELLGRLPVPDLHLWFNVCLPGVRELDIIVYHPRIGFWVIETKAVQLDGILEYAFNRCHIEGRQPDPGPVAQAQDGFRYLKRYLDSRMDRVPYFSVTACWPKILRRSWNERWNNAAVIGDYAERMIFREDLESGAEVLLKRLEHIAVHPPIGSDKARPEQPRVSASRLQKIVDSLSPIARPLPTLSEREKLRRIEKEIGDGIRRDFPPGEAKRVLFTGLPGTGKTFRLLQIGMWHAANGQRVLFTCFNKTLAADVRRLLQFSEVNRLAKYQIEVCDIFELTTRGFERNGLTVEGSVDADDWGRLVVNELVDQQHKAMHPIVDQFDTVLIDETQDMALWKLALLALHHGEQATLCAAFGRDQDLYEGAEDAQQWRDGLEERRLNRNFRNAPRVYYAAHAFFEAYPGKETAIQKSVERFLGGRKDREILFVFKGHGGTALRYVMESSENDDANQDDFMANQYMSVLRGELDAMAESGHLEPIDLLVLVPSERSTNAVWARRALEVVCSERNIEFIDYTKDDVRRVSANNNQVRLCTFHSARGLEGARVALLGFEVIKNWVQQDDQKVRNLGFIALSRAIFESTVVIRPELSSLPAVELLTKILAAEHAGPVYRGAMG